MEWSEDSWAMNFYTDNPIEDSLSASFSKMPFLMQKSRRLLSSNRLLLSSSNSVNMMYKLNFMMSEQSIHDVQPNLDHFGSLLLNNQMDDATFYRSCLKHRTYHYYIFGLAITVLLFLIYFVKVCCLLPATKDRGQIIPSSVGDWPCIPLTASLSTIAMGL